MSAVPVISDLQGPPPPEPVPHYEESELGNARRLCDRHGTDLRFVAEWKKWLAWNGHRWKLDITGNVERRAKEVADDVLNELVASGSSKITFARRSQSNSGINNMIALASTEPGIPVVVGQLDSDPWLLNVANGTLYLRTGQIRPAERKDLITKITNVIYDTTATCPTWLAFLERIMPDLEVRDFLQKVAGYSMTGLTSEQILVFLLGVGANGKSTWVETLLALLGDYATPAPPRLLMLEKHSEHPTQVADLLGKRLVVSQEVQQGHRLDEEMVKQLTGGDQLKARRMREDYWSFNPSHTLIMAANHKPRIAGRDHAIWRRIRLIPFDVTIPDDEQDKDLKGTLRAELPGILNWAIQGCLAWQQDGLAPPKSVIDATDKYRVESDLVAMFIGDNCTMADTVRVRSTDLYNAYKSWCADNGLEHPLSQKALAQRLSERGLDRMETTHPRHVWWVGIALTTANEEAML